MQVLQLLVLLANDLLVLEFKQLPLFLKVSYDLSKTLFEEINLCLEQLDLFILFKLLLSILLH